MHLRSTLAIATLSLASLSAFAAGGNFERALHTSATPSVAVYTPSGAIRIHPGSDIHIKADVYSSGGHSFFGGSDSSLDSRIQQIVNNPPIQQSGDNVQIGDRSHNDFYRNINIDYEITLPAGSHLDLQTGSGDIEIQAAGDGIHAHSGSGSIRAREVRGSLELQTGSGDVELQDAGLGNVQAQSGSGSLRLRNLQGSLDARTGSGDIEVSGHITGNSRAVTGSGSIRLDVGNTGLNLQAHTGSGSIRTNAPNQNSGEESRQRFSGPINGGGPTLDLTTGSGDIEVR